MIFRTTKYRELVLVLSPKTYKEVGGQRMIVPGSRAEFHNGKFETTDKKIIAALKEHEGFGTKFVAEDEEGAQTPNPVGAAKAREQKLQAAVAADTNPEPAK